MFFSIRNGGLVTGDYTHFNLSFKNDIDFTYVFRKNGNHNPADDVYKPAEEPSIQIPFRYYCDNLILNKMNFVIIGLGNFGASLAKKLSSMGHEVIGVDRDMSKVEFYKDRISQTICLDASDIHAIRSLPLTDADMVIVAIGHDFGSSVMITALLRKMNVKNIIRPRNFFHSYYGDESPGN